VDKTFQNDTLSIRSNNLFETTDPAALISYVTELPSRLISCDPVTGKPCKGNVKFSQTLVLSPLTPLNYKTLPFDILNYYASGYAQMVKQETADYTYLEFPDPIHSDPAYARYFPPREPRARRGHRRPDFAARANQLRSYRNECYAADGPRLASLQLVHFALRNLLTYIDESDLAEDFASKWFAFLKAQFVNPGSHSVLPGHPTAVVRRFSDISSSFTFSRVLVLGRR
jgi:hypothetical protein